MNPDDSTQAARGIQCACPTDPDFHVVVHTKKCLEKQIIAVAELPEVSECIELSEGVRPCPRCNSSSSVYKKEIYLSSVYADKLATYAVDISVGCKECGRDGFKMEANSMEDAVRRWNLMAQGFGEIPENIVQIIEEMEKLDYCDACEVESQEHYCVANRVRFLARMLKGFTK